MLQKVVTLCLICLLTACTVKPIPIKDKERYEEASKELAELFSRQEELHGNLDFYEALARGLKYNLDYRIKLINTALQAGQLELATFTMFPALNASGSVYNRNNKYASSGVTSTGQPTDVLTSTPNTIRSARTAISWNVLDFGMGYVKARQQGERVLIADEEARKQIQELSQDVLIAYWSAYSAQKLTKETKEFQRILQDAKRKMVLAMQDKTIPKENILNYQAALLEGDCRLIQLKYKYDKAMLDLKHLLNLPVNVTFTLAPLPVSLTKTQDLTNLDFKKLDAITLVKRPELRGQNYQERIAKLGVKLVLLQALPGLVLNDAWNYNSNTYLLNKIWIDRSVDTAWNLLNLASLPTAYKAAKIQVNYEKLKQMALALGALIETRYAYSNYETLRREYTIAHEQTENATAIYKLNRDRELASLANDQQVIIAKLRVLTAKMDEDLLLANLSSSLGQLYTSAGFDILPADILNKPLEDMTRLVSNNFILQKTWDFKTYVNISYDMIFPENLLPKLATKSKQIKKSQQMIQKKHRVHKIPEIEKVQMIQKLQKSRYCIQFFAAYKVDAVKNVQKNLKLANITHYAQFNIKGKDVYILIMGQYATSAEAYRKLKELPKYLRDLSPWVRETKGIKLIA